MKGVDNTHYVSIISINQEGYKNENPSFPSKYILDYYKENKNPFRSIMSSCCLVFITISNFHLVHVFCVIWVLFSFRLLCKGVGTNLISIFTPQHRGVLLWYFVWVCCQQGMLKTFPDPLAALLMIWIRILLWNVCCYFCPVDQTN